jgi:hypothetical protein
MRADPGRSLEISLTTPCKSDSQSPLITYISSFVLVKSVGHGLILKRFEACEVVKQTLDA